MKVNVNTNDPHHLFESVAKNKFLVMLAGSGGVGKTTLAMSLHSVSAKALATGEISGPWAVLKADPENKAIGQAVAPFLRIVFNKDVLEMLLKSDAAPYVRTAISAMKKAILNADDTVGRAILLTMSQSNRAQSSSKSFATNLSIYLGANDSKATFHEKIMGLGSEIQDRVNQSSISDIAFALSELATMPQIWRALWLHIATPAVQLAVADMAERVGKSYGHIASVKSEMTISEPGIAYELDSAVDNIYIGIWPQVDRKGLRADGLETSISMSPEDLVLGLSMMCSVRVGTITSQFSVDYSEFTDTLKGGLKEGMVMEIQRMNDLAARMGARIIVEGRDDYEAGSGSGSKDYEVETDSISSSSRRLMSSSHCAIYLTDKGRMWLRLRAYTIHESESETSGIVFSLKDIPNLKVNDDDTKQIEWYSTSKNNSKFELIQKATKTNSI